MEDKSFELLEKMYSELTEFRKETNARLDKIETTLKHGIKIKLQALHERAADNTSRLDEHGKQLADINNKLDYMVLSVDAQDKRLEVVESRKRKAK